MTVLTTSGVQISVSTYFRKDVSEPEDYEFLHNYSVEICNLNGYRIQLISRDWYIFDSLGAPRYVSGPGVVGEQPVLKPGERFEYTSSCDLTSDMGMMKGFYTFRNLSDDSLFEVFVPTFLLEFAPKLN